MRINLKDKAYDVTPSGWITVRYLNAYGRLASRHLKPGKAWNAVWQAYIDAGGKVSENPIPGYAVGALKTESPARRA